MGGFFTSIGISSAPLPQSNSYLHLLVSLLPLPNIELLESCGACVPDALHSSLVPASKKPEHCARISRCSTYLCSLFAFLIMISTSPVCKNSGNSFCNCMDPPPPPPACDRGCRWCRRTVEIGARELLVTDGDRWDLIPLETLVRVEPSSG